MQTIFELAAGADEATLQAAVKELRKNGCLLIHGVFPPDELARLKSSFAQRYEPALLQEGDANGSLQVGDRRFMTTIDLDSQFGDPDLFANPFLLRVLREVLEPGLLLNSFGGVTALDGSEHQVPHRDMRSLFGSPVETMLPAYAITVIAPLVDLGGPAGTTRVWPGSHATNQKQTDVDVEVDGLDPKVPVGSCLLMDYRLIHAGTANRSGKSRTILYLVYARPWFRDCLNFDSQPPLRAPRATLQSLSPEHRQLLAHCVVAPD